MELRTQYWLSTALAGVLLILVVLNIGFYLANAERQQEVNNRQLLIQQAAQLDALNREILQALAGLSLDNPNRAGDKQIAQLLARLGYTITPSPTPANPPPLPTRNPRQK